MNLRTLPVLAVLTLGSVNSPGGPFGATDPTFSHADFKQTVFPQRVISDRYGGLVWTFSNGSQFACANCPQLGGIIRTLESGELDTNFLVEPLFTETCATAVDSDGKILVAASKAGDFASNGQRNFRIFRLFANGSFDNSFGSPVFGSIPRFMSLQSDGKLVVGGQEVIGPLGNGGLSDTVRLNLDGSLDSTFHAPAISGGVPGLIFTPPAVDSLGRILLGGNFSFVGGTNYSGIFRVLTNGGLDSSFVPRGYSLSGSASIRGIAIQSDGKIVIAGGRFKITGNSTNYVLLRLNSDGSLDPTFKLVQAEAAGFQNLNRIRFLRQQPDGKLLAVGTTLARFNADGSLDNSFARLPFLDNFWMSFGECFWFELLSNGKMVVPITSPLQAGSNYLQNAFRLNSDGTVDSGFTPPVFQRKVYPVDSFLQADGKLLVWGAFDTVNGVRRRGVVRLDPSGSVDSTYAFGAFDDVQGISAGVAMPDSSLYAVLQRGTDPVMDVTNSLVHILANGQLDTNFQAAVDVSYVNPLLFAQDGRLLVWWGSEDDVINGVFSFYRLTKVGSIDPSFAVGTNALGLVQQDGSGNITNVVVGARQILTTVPGGKLIAVDTLDGVNYRVIRLLTNGVVDSAFTGPALLAGPPDTEGLAFSSTNGQTFYLTSTTLIAGASPITAGQSLADGSIFVTGRFRQLAGKNAGSFAKLQPNGMLDPSFSIGGGASLSSNPFRAARVDSLVIDGQGRIWLTGNFDHFNGIPVTGITRLNSDGAVDSSILPQIRFFDYSLSDTRASSIALATNVSVFVVGPFLVGNDVWPFALNKLIEYPPPTLAPKGYVPNSGFWFYLNIPESQSFLLQASTNLRDWQDLILIDGEPTPILIGDPNARNLPRRFYRLATP